MMHNGPQVQIRPGRESDASSLRDAVKVIAAEKWYLATVDGFSLEQTRAFLKHVLEGSHPQMVAIGDDESSDFAIFSLTQPKASRMSAASVWAFAPSGGGKELDVGCWTRVFSSPEKQVLKRSSSKYFPTTSAPCGFTNPWVSLRKA
jgi:hypothetical protein